VRPELFPEVLAGDAEQLGRPCALAFRDGEGLEQVLSLRLLEHDRERSDRTLSRSTRSGTRIVTLARELLVDRVLEGKLLHALYYRLSGVQLHVPTLRERTGDLRPLVLQLLRELLPAGRTVPRVSSAAWEALSRHGFPGNVRELRWALEHALVMGEGSPIDVKHLPVEVLRPR
jgi:DNA-binding NtrC family response regulator